MAFSFYFFDVYRISLLYLSNLTPHTMHSVRKQRLRVSKHTRRPSTRTRKQFGGQNPTKRTPSKRTPSKRTPSKRTPSKKELTKQLAEDIHTRIKTLWLSGDESSRKEFFYTFTATRSDKILACTSHQNTGPVATIIESGVNERDTYPG